MAAADPRARPRDQQLARADQVDRRQPGEPAATASRCPPTGARTRGRGLAVIAARAEALDPLHGRVRAAGAPAAAAARTARRRAAGAARRRPRDAASRSRSSPGPPLHDRRRRRSARAAAHQPRAQRRRRRARPRAAACGWAGRPRRAHAEIWVDDEGPGLAQTANLFVPFFTTKPGGSGIGLVLSRQIAEAPRRHAHAGQPCRRHRLPRPAPPADHHAVVVVPGFRQPGRPSQRQLTATLQNSDISRRHPLATRLL